MTGINTFITEYTADFVNSFKTTDDQTFQIKLQRNTKLHIFIQRVVMCLERSCCCTACIGYKHRRLYFHEAAAVKEVTDFLKNLGTFDKCISDFRIHDQIHITLTITNICVCQAMELLRKCMQTLGKERDLCCMNRNLTCLCLENFALDANDITDIKLLECLIGLCTQFISCYIRLNISLQITDIAERSLTHDTLLHHTAGYSHFLTFKFIKIVLNLHAVMGYVILSDQKRVIACCLKVSQLAASDFILFTDIWCLIVLCLCHFALSCSIR